MGKLTTTKAVIQKLGGVGEVAKVVGCTYNCAWNWTTLRTFPADTQPSMVKALEKLGHTAPSSLWCRPRRRRAKSRARRPAAKPAVEACA